MHVILKERLYDAAFVERWVLGLAELQDFVRDYTPEWAENGDRHPGGRNRRPGARDQQGQAVGHLPLRLPGRAPRQRDLPAPLHADAERPDGQRRGQGGDLFFKKGPGEVGAKARTQADRTEVPGHRRCRGPTRSAPRICPLPDPDHGVPQMLPGPSSTRTPYPVKALFVYRFEPLMSMPGHHRDRKAPRPKLDLIVTVDINASDIAWYSDVILPESIYLERNDCVQQANGHKPQLFVPQARPSPRATIPATRPSSSSRSASASASASFSPTRTARSWCAGSSRARGSPWRISRRNRLRRLHGKDQIFWDRKDGLKLKTPSKKIEFKSSLLENAGFPSFPAYEPVPALPGQALTG